MSLLSEFVAQETVASGGIRTMCPSG